MNTCRSLPSLVAAVLIISLLGAACTTQPAPEKTPEVITEEVPVTVETEPEEEAEEPTVAREVAEYKESPMLADVVSAGDLPSVEDRLPTNPMVVTPLESVGEYGGTWHMSMMGGQDQFFFFRTIGYEPWLRWTPEWDSYIPNIAENVEGNEDASQYTIKLREGMRWSDGEPFTTEDVQFWYEDVVLNEELTPSPPGRLTVNDEFVEIEIVDDYTFKAKFAGSFGFFPLRLAQGDAVEENISIGEQHPKHYLKQFHIDYNPDANELAQEAGFEGWAEYFRNRARWWINPERPTLNPWMLTTSYAEGVSMVAAERNPYYWKVDTEGNQLPYIDEVTFRVADSVDVMVLQGLNGEIDMQSRHIGVVANKPVFYDGQADGDYHLFDLKSSWGNSLCLYPNHSHPDPVMRELIHNKDFRIGLSHSIDRQEIVDTVYAGLAVPAQFAPHLDGPFANEQMTTQYTKYDVDLANEHLDKAGLAERDSEGFRLRPDGQRLRMSVDVAAARTDDVAISELVVEYWKQVGVDAVLTVVDRSIQWERKAANQQDIFVWPAGGGGGLDVLMNVQAYFPDRTAAFYAPAWGEWYSSGGAEGEEPIEEVKTMMEKYRTVQQLPTFDEQVAAMKEIIQMAADYFPHVCVCTQPDEFGIVKNDVHNVPDAMIKSSTYPNPGPTNPEQYYFGD